MDIAKQIKHFCCIEECLKKAQLIKEEQDCEDHFVATHRRAEDGRFIVLIELPFRANISLLGESRQLAERKF